MLDNFNDIMTVKDLQKALKIGRNVALRILQNGEIKSFRIGLSYKIPKKSVIEYIESKMI